MMKRLFVILFLFISYCLTAQDIKPMSPLFKNLQSPSFSFMTLDSSVWIYKGALYGWTKLADSARLHKDYVPYIGAIKDVNLGVNGITANDVTTNRVQINTLATPAPSAPGLIQWNAVDGTYDMGLLNSSILQVGQEIMFYGKAVGTIANGDLCQFAGVQGDHILIKKAVGSEIEVNPHFLIGVATENIANGVFGYVTWFGKINGIYTNTPNNQDSQNWMAGDILYFNNITGQLTKTMPSPPNRVITIAAVIKTQTGSSESGVIMVRPQAGYKFSELDDVNGTPLIQTGQFAVWDNSNKYFDFNYNINDYLSYTSLADTKNPTGFVNGDGIQIDYDHTNRTITLTGDLRYYWRGVEKTLTSPWISPPHTATVGSWYLMSTDGDNFVWSNSVWGFDDIMVAALRYSTTATSTFAIRETHGLMDWKSHEEFHQQIGTYLLSGGKLTAGTYAENTQTDAAITPAFDAAVLKDEDNNTTIPAWTDGVYTTMYIGATNSSVFNISSTMPFTYDIYIQVNNTLTGTLTNAVTNKYYNVYQILIPVTADINSQRYRMVMLTPQQTYNTLAEAQGEVVQSLNLGNLSTLSPEFKIYSRITYYTNASYTTTGKVVIATNGIGYITGSNINNTVFNAASTSNHAALSNLTWLNSGHSGTNSTIAAFNSSGVAENLTKGNLTAGSNKISIGGNWVGAVIGTGASVDVSEANLTLSNIGGSVTDNQVPNTITLDSITQITNRSHTNLYDIGTNSHAQIDSHILNDNDIDNSNELQSLSTDGSPGNITLSKSGGTININVNDADASTVNELNSSMTFDNGNRILSLTDAGGTKTVTIPQGDIVNCFMNTFEPTSTNVMVVWPSNFADTNYSLDVKHWWTKTVNGKSIIVNSAIYDFSKTVSGFSCKLDTLVGYITYMAVNSSNLYPINISNYVPTSRTITINGLTYDLSADRSFSVNEMVYPSTPGIAIFNGTTWGTSITDNHTNWDKYNQWDGGSTGLTASTGRTSLGATTIGSNLFTLTNPSAVTFPRFNADNTVSALSATDFRTAIGAGSVNSPLTLKFDTGTTEGTDLYTFDGSASKTIDIKAGTNITLTKAAGSITINSSGGSSSNFDSMRYMEGIVTATPNAGSNQYGYVSDVSESYSTNSFDYSFYGTARIYKPNGAYGSSVYLMIQAPYLVSQLPYLLFKYKYYPGTFTRATKVGLGSTSPYTSGESNICAMSNGSRIYFKTSDGSGEQSTDTGIDISSTSPAFFLSIEISSTSSVTFTLYNANTKAVLATATHTNYIPTSGSLYMVNLLVDYTGSTNNSLYHYFSKIRITR